ncbi:MAG: hypothetical protein ABI193_02845 [Minicystis sp.]
MRFFPTIGLVFLAGCAASPAEGPASAEARVADEAPVGRVPLTADGEKGPEIAPRVLAASRTGNPWMDCYRRFQPSADTASDLARLGEMCGEPAGLVPVSSIHVGTQAAADPPDRLTFRARKGRCYRLFAVGAPSIVDLDVAVFDAQHSLVAADLSTDRWSVVPPRGPLCAPRSGRYTFEIAVAEGGGDYVVQVWGTKDEPDDDAPGNNE